MTPLGYGPDLTFLLCAQNAHHFDILYGLIYIYCIKIICQCQTYPLFSARRHRTSTKIPRPVQGCEGPPALPLKTIRRKVFSKKMEYVEPEESYDTIENYPLRPPPIPPPIPPKQKPPPVPPRN